MSQQITISSTELTRLAELLEQAGRVARDLSKGKATSVSRLKEAPKDQEWYWSKKWQEWEREADEDIAKGRVKGFDSMKELIVDLNL